MTLGLSRLVGPTSQPARMASRRTISFFSKSGNTRIFANAKTPRALTTPTGSQGSSTSSSNSTAVAIRGPESSSSIVSAEKPTTASNDIEHGQSSSPADPTPETTVRAQSTTAADESISSDKEHDSQFASSGVEKRSHSSVNHHHFHERAPILHPQPTKDVVSLHSFFSLHRPLLLLPEHAQQPLFNPTTGRSTIFDSLDASKEDTRTREKKELARVEPLFEVELGSGRPLPNDDGISLQGLMSDEEMPEADADAARLLGRSFIVNNIGSFVDWQGTLKTLGDATAQKSLDTIRTAAAEVSADPDMSPDVAMDSVKRKKKKKMNKHIYKKRRKRERAQRRRLGK